MLWYRFGSNCVRPSYVGTVEVISTSRALEMLRHIPSEFHSNGQVLSLFRDFEGLLDGVILEGDGGLREGLVGDKDELVSSGDLVNVPNETPCLWYVYDVG